MDMFVLLLLVCVHRAASSIFTPEKTKEELMFEDIIKGRMTLKKNQLECVEETKVEPEMVLGIKKGYWRQNDENLKYWMLCITNKSGIMSKEGVLRMDVALYNIPSEDVSELESQINSCLGIPTLPPHEIAWQFAKCYKNLNPQPKYNIF